MKRLRIYGPGALGIGTIGALYGLAMQDGSFALLSGIAALLAGGLTIGLFGRPGRRGWLLGGVGAVTSTALGAALVGAFFVYPRGILIGPAAVLDFGIDHLHVGLMWLGAMAAVHMLTQSRKQLVLT